LAWCRTSPRRPVCGSKSRERADTLAPA
jgi:hypothetical protein